MNRLAELLGRESEPEPHEDLYWIETHYDNYAVSRCTASDVERVLDGHLVPRWLVFRDLSGARHRILTAHVYAITESTAAQRAVARQFRRALRQEDKADQRPWEEE